MIDAYYRADHGGKSEIQKVMPPGDDVYMHDLVVTCKAIHDLVSTGVGVSGKDRKRNSGCGCWR